MTNRVSPGICPMRAFSPVGMASTQNVLDVIHLAAWSLTAKLCLWCLAYQLYPPLHSAEALVLLVVGKCLLFGGLDSRRSGLHVLAIAVSVFPSSFYFGVPSLVGDAVFGMDSGVKRFNKGTSAYPVSIFEKWFPPFDANASDCRYVRVSGARKQWESNGLYVKTGDAMEPTTTSAQVVRSPLWTDTCSQRRSADCSCASGVGSLIRVTGRAATHHISI